MGTSSSVLNRATLQDVTRAVDLAKTSPLTLSLSAGSLLPKPVRLSSSRSDSRLGRAIQGQLARRKRKERLIRDRYRVIQRLGCGTDACVFECVDTTVHDVRVAIKTVVLEEDPFDGFESDEEFQDSRVTQGVGEAKMHRLLNSKSALGTSNACPYLSFFIDSFYDQGQAAGPNDRAEPYDDVFGLLGDSTVRAFCIVTEFCDGGSLADLAGKSCTRARVSEEEMAMLCASIALGLRYMHRRGVIHRDIKSGNILLTLDGRCKLADFGISAVVGSGDGRHKKKQTLCGTPAFMAPEVITESTKFSPCAATTNGFNEDDEEDGDLEDDSDDDDDDDDYSHRTTSRRKPAAAGPDNPHGRTDSFNGLLSNGAATSPVRPFHDETGYTTKADIWSLGITAIELADGETPSAKDHWTNAYGLMSSITNSPSPVTHRRTPSTEGDWSPAFNNFLEKCLNKNPDLRASAEDLCKHPFVANACANLQANGGRSSVIAAVARRAHQDEDEDCRELHSKQSSSSQSSPSSSPSSSTSSTPRRSGGTRVQSPPLKKARGKVSYSEVASSLLKAAHQSQKPQTKTRWVEVDGQWVPEVVELDGDPANNDGGDDNENENEEDKDNGSGGGNWVYTTPRGISRKRVSTLDVVKEEEEEANEEHDEDDEEDDLRMIRRTHRNNVNFLGAHSGHSLFQPSLSVP